MVTRCSRYIFSLFSDWLRQNADKRSGCIVAHSIGRCARGPRLLKEEERLKHNNALAASAGGATGRRVITQREEE